MKTITRNIPEKLQKMNRVDFEAIFGRHLPDSLFGRQNGNHGHIYGFFLDDKKSIITLQLLDRADVKLVSIHVGKALKIMEEGAGRDF